MMKPMFGSTLQESVPTCVQDWAPAGKESIAAKVNVAIRKQFRSMVVTCEIHSCERSHGSANDSGHCLHGFFVRIGQAALDELIALLVQMIDVELRTS